MHLVVLRIALTAVPGPLRVNRRLVTALLAQQVGMGLQKLWDMSHIRQVAISSASACKHKLALNEGLGHTAM